MLCNTPSADGKLNPMNYTFRWKWTYRPGGTMQISGKSTSGKDQNILRWGHSPTGNFSVKEAYHLQENHQGKPKEHIWSKIWNPKFWLKVSIFLWLISQNRILTWDNLQK
jgi:hypothetical protein